VKRGAALLWAGLALLAPAIAHAIDPGEVRDYGEVFAISAEADSRERITVRWDIEPGYYLYHNRFLSFHSDTPGVVLGEPDVPPGERQYDELLGEEVIKFHGRLEVVLPLLLVPADASLVALTVRSQGCLEGVLCYPPTEQQLRVALPADIHAMMAAPQSMNGLGADLSSGPRSDPLATLDQDLLGREAALLPEEAFRFEAIGLNAETILARFTAQPGYYLYVDKFRFRVVGSPGFEVREAELPEGQIKDDPEFGPVRVIYDQAEIPVRVNRPAGPEQSIVLEAEYQGCRDGDICYPPQTSDVRLLIAEAVADIRGPGAPATERPLQEPPVSEQNRLARMLLDNPDGALFAFFLAGLLLAFTPCVFPMIPILSGIIAGQGAGLTTRRAFWLSVVFVFAMALTYTLAGVLAGLFGKNLQAFFQNPWIISAFVLLFIALALSMFGVYDLQLPSRWQTALTRHSNRQQGGRWGGVAVMGLLSALIVGPCVAPPLAAALIVIGTSGDPLLGGSALFAMSLGMGTPLVLFGTSAGKLIPRAGPWMRAVKAVFGVGLLALAIWMLERILPGVVIMLLWGVLGIACGVFLGALRRLPDGASGWQQLWKAVGLVLLLGGAVEIVGAASGGDYWLRPLGHLRPGHGVESSRPAEFQRIKSLDDLRRAVTQAGAAGKPSMLDFYADWCVECLRMERNTFPVPEVRALLGRMQALQADVTAHDAVDRELMAEFGVIGPPAILFFDRSGHEMPAYRLVGYFSPDEFSAHLELVLDAP